MADRNNAYGACTNGSPFVAKINPTLSGDPSLVYSTCFGTSGGGRGTSIVVDANGNAYITGSTSSTSFPLVGQIQNFQGASAAFVAKVGPADQPQRRADALPDPVRGRRAEQFVLHLHSLPGLPGHRRRLSLRRPERAVRGSR